LYGELHEIRVGNKSCTKSKKMLGKRDIYAAFLVGGEGGVLEKMGEVKET
jgi:hypothetical protein